MAIQCSQIGVPNNRTSSSCITGNCPANVCPDFSIKRHDTKPAFRVAVEDCDGPFDLTDESLVVEISMWVNAKLRTAITAEDTALRLADNIGFDQIMVGDIIVMNQVRAPEYMLVTNFDEVNKFVQVQRGYSGTLAKPWIKGTGLKIFRIMGATASYELAYEDILQVDGTTLKDQLVDSFLVYEWDANDTCLPGCYVVEFKLLKMTVVESVSMLATSDIPSWSPSTIDYHCDKGIGVDWIRRFPSNKEGFIIEIIDSPTAEM